MNAVALALPTPLTPNGLSSALEQPAAAPLAAPAQAPLDAVARTAALLRAACRRGQLEDASAAARVALRTVTPHAPHEALLRALAQAQPALMVAPDEHRLYLLRDADGSALGLMRLRGNGRVATAEPACARRWQLRNGNLELCDADQRPIVRFALCGEHGGERLYLGETVEPAAGDASPRLLQELSCTYTRLRLLDPELTSSFCSLFDADSLVPADLPAGPTLLLAAPHCGGAALRQALNRCAGIFIDGELMQPQAIGLAEGLLPAARAGALYELRGKDPAWFARMMMNRSHDEAGRDLTRMPVRGFSLAPMHSSEALDWAIAEPRLRIVSVVRSNLLAEFADILADQANQADPPTRPVEGCQLHFDPERFTRFVDLKRRGSASLRQRLVQRNADTVEVDGSRLNAATLAELIDFLGDGVITVPTAGVAGVAGVAATAPQDRVIDRFDKPDAVAQCLTELGHAGWGEIEGLLPDFA